MRPIDLTFLLLTLGPLPASGQGAYYGPGIQADSLANTPLGRSGVEVSCRFRAEQSAPLQAIRTYLIWSFAKPGYHAGTGGTLGVTLEGDDDRPGHGPSGQVLARSVQRMGIVPSNDRFFPQLFFDRAPLLKAGALYHLVFRNSDPDPEHNFVSLNALFNLVGGSPQQPGRADLDWAMLFRSKAKPAWVVRRTPGSSESFTPILEIDYGNGRSQGMGYIEFWMGAGKPIAGPAAVREAFTVTGKARKVTGAAVRVRRLTGSAPLVARLETADGKPLAEARGGGASLSPSASGSLGGSQWVTFSWAAPVPLNPGSSYRLVLSCPGPGRYEAFPMRKGSDKGFSDTTLFADGHAEFTDGSGWVGWEQWGKKNLTNSDLQFYLRVAP